MDIAAFQVQTHCCAYYKLKKKNMAGGEDGLEAVEVLQALELTGEKRPSPFSGKSIVACKLFDFVFKAFPRLQFIERKAQTESGKSSLPRKKELSSRHVCFHTTDQSHAQDSANLEHFICCETSWSRTQ